MKPYHYASHKPTVVLFEPIDDPTNLKVMQEDGKTLVFKNKSKAAKYVSQKVDHKIWSQLRYVNETPEYDAGSRQETQHKKCLKCKSFLRPSPDFSTVKVQGKVIQINNYDCPVCDLGETPNAKI